MSTDVVFDPKRVDKKHNNGLNLPDSLIKRWWSSDVTAVNNSYKNNNVNYNREYPLPDIFRSDPRKYKDVFPLQSHWIMQRYVTKVNEGIYKFLNYFDMKSSTFAPGFNKKEKTNYIHRIAKDLAAKANKEEIRNYSRDLINTLINMDGYDKLSPYLNFLIAILSDFINKTPLTIPTDKEWSRPGFNRIMNPGLVKMQNTYDCIKVFAWAHNYEEPKILFDYLGNRVACLTIIAKDPSASTAAENVFISSEIYSVDRYIWAAAPFNTKSSADWLTNTMYGDLTEEITYRFSPCFGGHCISAEEILTRKKVIDLYVNGEYKTIITGEGHPFGTVFDSMGMLRDPTFNGPLKDLPFTFKSIVDGFLHYGLKQKVTGIMVNMPKDDKWDIDRIRDVLLWMFEITTYRDKTITNFFVDQYVDRDDICCVPFQVAIGSNFSEDRKDNNSLVRQPYFMDPKFIKKYETGREDGTTRYNLKFKIEEDDEEDNILSINQEKITVDFSFFYNKLMDGGFMNKMDLCEIIFRTYAKKSPHVYGYFLLRGKAIKTRSDMINLFNGELRFENNSDDIIIGKKIYENGVDQLAEIFKEYNLNTSENMAGRFKQDPERRYITVNKFVKGDRSDSGGGPPPPPPPDEEEYEDIADEEITITPDVTEPVIANERAAITVVQSDIPEIPIEELITEEEEEEEPTPPPPVQTVATVDQPMVEIVPGQNLVPVGESPMSAPDIDLPIPGLPGPQPQIMEVTSGGPIIEEIESPPILPIQPPLPLPAPPTPQEPPKSILQPPKLIVEPKEVVVPTPPVIEQPKTPEEVPKQIVPPSPAVVSPPSPTTIPQEPPTQPSPIPSQPPVNIIPTQVPPRPGIGERPYPFFEPITPDTPAITPPKLVIKKPADEVIVEEPEEEEKPFVIIDEDEKMGEVEVGQGFPEPFSDRLTVDDLPLEDPRFKSEDVDDIMVAIDSQLEELGEGVGGDGDGGAFIIDPTLPPEVFIDIVDKTINVIEKRVATKRKISDDEEAESESARTRTWVRTTPKDFSGLTAATRGPRINITPKKKRKIVVTTEEEEKLLKEPVTESVEDLPSYEEVKLLDESDNEDDELDITSTPEDMETLKQSRAAPIRARRRGVVMDEESPIKPGSQPVDTSDATKISTDTDELTQQE
ncbi:ORF78 [Ostreid herpesvirus 1]|uniref:Uncharacterized protein ORF78 n=1 Tax=Ostreid herpesvirus 1 (isolate France) TaxID=654903 RepID=Y078_OSHVF|nr:ORF78 [Ostreid herpesvirus 1]Q6R7F1.1 RecName: Full=Uncharacterized protein ORF78 [Ostreid herpesvirus 1 (isolate France)]AAS00964.1 ORF78 [Ostreid herpesvirus 1]